MVTHQCSQSARHRPPPPPYHIQTNGTLFTLEIDNCCCCRRRAGSSVRFSLSEGIGFEDVFLNVAGKKKSCRRRLFTPGRDRTNKLFPSVCGVHLTSARGCVQLHTPIPLLGATATIAPAWPAASAVHESVSGNVVGKAE